MIVMNYGLRDEQVRSGDESEVWLTGLQVLDGRMNAGAGFLEKVLDRRWRSDMQVPEGAWPQEGGTKGWGLGRTRTPESPGQWWA